MKLQLSIVSTQRSDSLQHLRYCGVCEHVPRKSVLVEHVDQVLDPPLPRLELLSADETRAFGLTSECHYTRIGTSSFVDKLRSPNADRRETSSALASQRVLVLENLQSALMER